MRSSFTYKKGGSSSTYRTVAADWLKPAGPISMFQPFAYDMAFAVRRMAGDSQVLTISPDGFCVSDKLLALNTSYPKGLCDKLIFGGIRSIKVNRPLRTIEVTNGLVAIFEVVMNPNGKTLEGVIKELTEMNIGIIITDHNVKETLDIVDKVYIIHNHKILVFLNTIISCRFK